MTATHRQRTAAVLTVGDELMTGKVVDSNSAAIARFLFLRGYRLTHKLSVGDTESAIIRATREALRRADIVIMTGGLGPTHDDITKAALCRLFKCGTKRRPSVLRQVRSFFTRAGREMPEINQTYADIPTAAVAVCNRMGAAPGLFFGKKVLALPGVPHETLYMLEHEAKKLLPHGGIYVAERTFRTAGMGEVGLSKRMTKLREAISLVDVAFLPSYGRVDIRLIARGATAKEAKGTLRKAVRLLYPSIKGQVWGFDDVAIEETIGVKLRKAGKTLAVAESCTGGGIGKRITSVAGSSDYFLGGAISYSNGIKTTTLGVPAALLKKHGAVSAECAEAMAAGARKTFGADYALSVTGIAGPGGGTKAKPVGLVYLAIAGHGWVRVKRLDLVGAREAIRERAVNEALFFLNEILSLPSRNRG